MEGVKHSFGDTCNEAGVFPLEARPYFEQGFGRVILGDTLYFQDRDFSFLHIPSLVANEDTFHDDSLGTGESRQYEYCAFPGDGEIRISLVLTDYPSTISADVNLVNDLDLVVVFERESEVAIAGNSKFYVDALLKVCRSIAAVFGIGCRRRPSEQRRNCASIPSIRG